MSVGDQKQEVAARPGRAKDCRRALEAAGGEDVDAPCGRRGSNPMTLIWGVWPPETHDNKWVLS